MVQTFLGILLFLCIHDLLHIVYKQMCKESNGNCACFDTCNNFRAQFPYAGFLPYTLNCIHNIFSYAPYITWFPSHGSNVKRQIQSL